ncbi:MAG TPA: hypothetical protein VIO62_15870 [Candidatus Dormibacteraeota bacterium]|jgi:hypothetical protein
MNIDDDVRNRDWLRIVARMRAVRAKQPELTDAEIRVVALARPPDELAPQRYGGLGASAARPVGRR